MQLQIGLLISAGSKTTQIGVSNLSAVLKRAILLTESERAKDPRIWEFRNYVTPCRSQAAARSSDDRALRMCPSTCSASLPTSAKRPEPQVFCQARPMKYTPGTGDTPRR